MNQLLALIATILVSALLVAGLAWVGKRKHAAKGSGSPSNLPIVSKILVVLGLLLLGVGVFYVFGSHSVLQQFPILDSLPHNAHVYIGGGGAVLGLVSLLLGEVLRRRAMV